MRYGTPYKGSKNAIAPWVVSRLPSATHFYDLFAGGCAVTHCAMLTGWWEDIVINDIDDGPRLFLDAIDGKYKNETRWISRENFYKLKDSDPYIRYCWSFGNNGRDYLYSREIEPWKKALHYARVLHDTSLLRAMGIDSDGSRKDIKARKEEYKEKYITWYLQNRGMNQAGIDALKQQAKDDIAKTEEELRQYLVGALKKSGLTQVEVGRRLGTQMQGHYFGKSQWVFPTQEYYEKMQAFMPALTVPYMEIVGLYNLRKSLGRLQRLQSLKRLGSLGSLERLQSLESRPRLHQKDYQEVPILPNSVIYCDIPYQGKNPYSEAFDYERFFNWCERQTELVIISEYAMPEERFLCIAEVPKRCAYSASNNSRRTIEKLFIPVHQKALFEKMWEATPVDR